MWIFYDAEDCEGGECVVCGEIAIFEGNAGPCVVLLFGKPRGVGVKLLAIELQGHYRLNRHGKYI